jgi:hypothetical protein
MIRSVCGCENAKEKKSFFQIKEQNRKERKEKK